MAKISFTVRDEVKRVTLTQVGSKRINQSIPDLEIWHDEYTAVRDKAFAIISDWVLKGDVVCEKVMSGSTPVGYCFISNEVDSKLALNAVMELW